MYRIITYPNTFLDKLQKIYSNVPVFQLQLTHLYILQTYTHNTFNYYKFIVFQPHVKMFYNNNSTVLLIIRNNIGKTRESPATLGLRRITLPSSNT